MTGVSKHVAILIWLYARRKSTPLPVSPAPTDSQGDGGGGGGLGRGGGRRQVNETFSLPENINFRI